ncbi:MAG: hypothetical protein IKN85_08705 [Oscillospiraceae bacterium]|nr:hypothetical protein [Oscillospiraceae bacterium]MBR3022923.1 hypothetical protein [Oscillospiraceae bacterium]MBR3535895.1 hypothetical protein [Oscillospiraceae bacterium]MBR6924568.1 hypothetical protein [Oscillospiraceae bacterium]
MGINLEEMAANMGIDPEMLGKVKDAAASGDFAGAMESMSGVLAEKGIDVNALKDKVDMNKVMEMAKNVDFKEMAKNVDLKDMSPEKIKEMASQFMGGANK